MLALNDDSYKIRFNPALFNDLFYKLRDCDKTYICNYGSGGSGKSHATAQNELIKSLQKKEKILVIRKTANTLMDSVVSLIYNTLIVDYGLLPFYELNKSDRIITNKVNGSQFLFRGLDDPEKIKSIDGITRVWIEEASELSEDDFNKLSDRIRGEAQITLTYNPISVKHWLKSRFHDQENERVQVFHTTYKDNLRFVGEKFIQDMEWYKVNRPDHYWVYGEGKWGKLQVEREFAYAFNSLKHIKKGLEFDTAEPIYLSFDFNIDPITCLACQHTEEGIKILKEFRLGNSDIYQLCECIRAILGNRIYLVTGDATGRSGSAMTRGNVNYYTVIQQELNLSDGQINVPRINPSVSNSRVLLNAILERHPNFAIDESCEYLAEDLLYVEADDSGGIDKGKDKRRSHLLDCLRYYLFSYHSSFLYPDN